MALTVDELRESREIPQVGYLDFVLHTNQSKDGLFCFFEGANGGDNLYYVPRIKQFVEKYHPIRCNNRDNVLKVYELIVVHQEYNKYKKAFFIDRDFHEPLAQRNPPVFETPCYSIENLYVTMSVFKEILKNPLNLSEASDQFEYCVKLFSERQQEFHSAVMLFNAWYACLIEIRDATGKKAVRLSDKLPKGFIDFSLKSVTKNYEIKELNIAFQNTIVIPDEKLNKKIDDFSKCDQHKTFRGKYELEFLLTFIELILQDSRGVQLFIKEKLKFNFNDKLSVDQALGIFSSFAETPQCLYDYLQLVTTN